ncbi:unnamed protein product [Urochloa humidicola]
MTFAAVARLSRRHLPVVATPSRMGGSRTAACVHEPGRLPSPFPRHSFGRLLPCPARQLRGVLPSPPLLQTQRFVSSGAKKEMGIAGAFCTENNAKMMKSNSVESACVAEEFVSLMQELEEISQQLDRDLNLFKNTVILLFGLTGAAAVSFPVQIISMAKDKEELNPKMRKRNAEAQSVMQQAEAGRSAAVELQKWFSDELVKKRAKDT